MKRKLLLVTAVSVLLLALSGCTVRSEGESAGIITAGEPDKDIKSITVSAEGKVTVSPDVAYVTVGVTTQDKDMQKAQDRNAEVMSAMTAALKSAGLTDEDIQTTQYNAYPIYDYSSGKQNIVNYEVSNLVELTIKEMNRVGEFIDIAVNNGANITNSISFGVLDQQASYDEALKLAVAAAKAKADTLAGSGGIKIAGILQMTENSSGGEVYRYETAAADMQSASTPISSGTLDIRANVTIVYEIE